MSKNVRNFAPVKFCDFVDEKFGYLLSVSFKNICVYIVIVLSKVSSILKFQILNASVNYFFTIREIYGFYTIS